MNLTTQFEAFKKQIAELDRDFEKFNNKGNKAAATRLRKQLQSVKQSAQEMRVAILESKNAHEGPDHNN